MSRKVDQHPMQEYRSTSVQTLEVFLMEKLGELYSLVQQKPEMKHFLHVLPFKNNQLLFNLTVDFNESPFKCEYIGADLRKAHSDIEKAVSKVLTVDKAAPVKLISIIDEQAYNDVKAGRRPVSSERPSSFQQDPLPSAQQQTSPSPVNADANQPEAPRAQVIAGRAPSSGRFGLFHHSQPPGRPRASSAPVNSDAKENASKAESSAEPSSPRGRSSSK